jgi:hypothetical protein
MTSCAAVVAPASRLRKPTAVALAFVTAKLNVPFPVTSGVTSIVTQPLLNAPVDRIEAAGRDGAFDQVIVDSPQPVFATPHSTKPTLELLFEETRKVAFVTCPDVFATLKRR